MLCDDLAGQDGEAGVGGRPKREGMYVYLELIHRIVQEKLTQHCKETVLQFFLMHIIEKTPKNDKTVLESPGLLLPCPALTESHFLC